MSVISAGFRLLARWIARRPLLFVLAPLLLSAWLASGLLVKGLAIDTDANKIWVPQGSETAQQKAFFDAAFDPFFRVNQAILSLDGSVTDDSDGAAAGILQPAYLQALLALQQQIVSGATSSGGMLSDVCYRPILGKGCLIETPLDFFKSNATVIANLTVTTIQEGIACRLVPGVPGLPCVSSIGVPVQASVVLGGASCPASPVPGFNASVCGGCGGTSATALILTFLLQARAELSDAGAAWEAEVFLPAVAAFSFPGTRLSYMAERSISDQLAIVDIQNQGVVASSYIVMLAYIAFALGKTPHPVASRALLAVVGIGVVGLSVLGALGAAAWTGLHVTMIVEEVVPFLILAIGVDNMVIMAKAMDRSWAGPAAAWSGQEGARKGMSLEAAFEEALAEVGPTITAAALCEVASFVVGISTSIPALKNFCIVAAVAVLIDFFLQISIFAAALLMDGRRQEAGRADLLPCLKLRAKDRSEAEGYRYAWAWGCNWRSAASATCINGPPEVELSAWEEAGGGEASSGLLAGGAVQVAMQGEGAHLLPADEGLLDGFGPAVDAVAEAAEAGADDELSGAGKEGKTPAASFARFTNRGSVVRTVIARYWAPCVLNRHVMVLVLLIWFVLLGISAAGLRALSLGLEQQLVLPRGSYLSSYFTDQSRLGDAGPPMYVVLQNVNYTHPNASSGISTLVDTLASELTDVLVPPIFSWLGDFETWTSDTTRTLIVANPTWGCPAPLDGSLPHAARVAQFVFGVPIDSDCCQGRGYCGAQYSGDVKFLWGLPKAPPANGSGVAAVSPGGRSHVTKSGRAVNVVREGFADAGVPDDGGCDLAAGYATQEEVESALGWAARAQTVHVPAHRLPSHLLAAGVERAGGEDGVTLIPCHVLTSRLRGQHTPLRNQSDFINGMQRVQAAVSVLQAALLPVADLTQYGITGYGPLAPGAAINGSAWTNGSTPAIPDPAYGDDNAHTSWMAPAPGGAAFPYSLVYVYYEQYSFIRAVAIGNLLLAVAAVFLASLFLTTPATALTVTCLVASATVCLGGWVWMLNPHGVPDPYGGGPYGVDINAVSVVNAVTATGLSVEFIVHIAAAFFASAGKGEGEEEEQYDGPVKAVRAFCSPRARAARAARARSALIVMGAPVVTGISLTKLAGVIVLATAPSALFRLYYFRMYLGIIVLGVFHGLVLLPVLLACCGGAGGRARR